MKMNSYRCPHLVAFAFVLATASPLIRADEPSPNPVVGQVPSPQVSPEIPKIHDSVTHFVLFSGPKDIIKEMINTTLMSPVRIADPAITIESDVIQFAPNIPAGIPVGVDTSPIRVSIGGSFPAENGGHIYQIILKSYKPISKAELEELFVKYLKAVDQKLMIYNLSLARDLTEKRNSLSRRVESAKRMVQKHKELLFQYEERMGSSMGAEDIGKYELDLLRDLAKIELELQILEVQRKTLENSVDSEDLADTDESNSPSSVILDLLAQRKELVARLGEKHPNVKAIDEKIDLFSQQRKIEINKNSKSSVRSSLSVKLNEAFKAREIALVKQERTKHQLSELRRLKQELNEVERMKSSVNLDIRGAEEQIAKLRSELLELDDTSHHIINDRLANHQMGMITILDPASKPETKAEEKAPSSDAKESKPAPDSKEEKDPTSPAPAGSPK